MQHLEEQNQDCQREMADPRRSNEEIAQRLRIVEAEKNTLAKAVISTRAIRRCERLIGQQQTTLVY